MTATLTTILSTAALAQTDNVESVLSAFRDWTERYGVTDAAIAVTVDGVVVGTDAIGDYTPDLPVPVASESKAITGLCVARLVDDGRLGFDATLGDLLPAFFDANAVDERATGITIGELLTHTSGIVNDPTQGTSLNQFRPFSEAAPAAVLAAALARSLGAEPGSRYAYNNANYAALQLVVERITQQDYEAACRELVLDPAGVLNADLNPDWRMMGGFGGWRISVTDFARVLRYFLPDSDLLGLPVDDWPSTDLGGGASYRLGVLVREAGTGHNFWHQGAWVTSNPPTSFGAFFALWQNIGIVVAYAPNASNSAVTALDSALYQAAHP